MATTLNRNVISERVAKETGIPVREVRRLTRALISVLSAQLANGGDVVLRRFGTFMIKERKAKVGRCPSRPEMGEFLIPAHNQVVFLPSSELRKNVIKLPLGV